MPGACYGVALEFALRERTAKMGADLADAVDAALGPCQHHAGTVYGCAMGLAIGQLRFGQRGCSLLDFGFAGRVIDADFLPVYEFAAQVCRCGGSQKAGERKCASGDAVLAPSAH